MCHLITICYYVKHFLLRLPPNGPLIKGPKLAFATVLSGTSENSEGAPAGSVGLRGRTPAAHSIIQATQTRS